MCMQYATDQYICQRLFAMRCLCARKTFAVADVYLRRKLNWERLQRTRYLRRRANVRLGRPTLCTRARALVSCTLYVVISETHANL